jgi:hypothetical protein
MVRIAVTPSLLHYQGLTARGFGRRQTGRAWSGSKAHIVDRMAAKRGPARAILSDLAGGASGDATMSDDTTDDIDPPLTPLERRRRIAILCCNFMRNLALHRAGLQPQVRDNLLINPYQREFWVPAHGNFLDMCVLEWCKLFADYEGEHHWHRIVDDRAGFKKDLYIKLGVRGDAFAKMVEKIKHYRDKFVAHLDEEREMRFPDLKVAREAIVFLYEHLAQLITGREEWQDLPASAEELELLFKRASQHAESVYAEAVRAAQRL